MVVFVSFVPFVTLYWGNSYSVLPKIELFCDRESDFFIEIRNFECSDFLNVSYSAEKRHKQSDRATLYEPMRIVFKP